MVWGSCRWAGGCSVVVSGDERLRLKQLGLSSGSCLDPWIGIRLVLGLSLRWW